MTNTDSAIITMRRHIKKLEADVKLANARILALESRQQIVVLHEPVMPAMPIQPYPPYYLLQYPVNVC